MMRLVSTLALAAALGVSVVATSADAQRRGGQPQQPAAPTGLSKAFAEAYNAITTLVQANNLAGAKDAYLKLTPANDAERLQAGIMGVALGQKLNDSALVGSAADAILALPNVKPEDRAQYSFLKGAASANPAAMAQAYEAGFKPEGIEANIATAYYLTKDTANGDTWMKRAADRQIAAGKSPVQIYYEALVQNVRVDNFAGAQPWARLLGGLSLVPDQWRLIVEVARRGSGGQEPQVDLDLLRLMRHAKAMTLPDNYRAYLGATSPIRLPGEVGAIIAEGKAAGVIKGNEDYILRIGKEASDRLSVDRASLATIDKDAASAANGVSAAAGADSLLGYGEYDRAARLYQTALVKGGVDANRINARLGIARAYAGDLAGAEAAFKAVAGGPWKTVADYWLIYLQAKARNAPMTAPSAAS